MDEQNSLSRGGVNDSQETTGNGGKFTKYFMYVIPVWLVLGVYAFMVEDVFFLFLSLPLFMSNALFFLQRQNVVEKDLKLAQFSMIVFGVTPLICVLIALGYHSGAQSSRYDSESPVFKSTAQMRDYYRGKGIVKEEIFISGKVSEENFSQTEWGKKCAAVAEGTVWSAGGIEIDLNDGMLITGWIPRDGTNDKGRRIAQNWTRVGMGGSSKLCLEIGKSVSVHAKIFGNLHKDEDLGHFSITPLGIYQGPTAGHKTYLQDRAASRIWDMIMIVISLSMVPVTAYFFFSYWPQWKRLQQSAKESATES